MNKKLVHFHPHPQKCEPEQYKSFDLVLNTKIDYDRLAEKAAAELGVPATHLRFYTVNSSTGNPRAAVKRSSQAVHSNPQTVHSILFPTQYSQLNMNQRNDSLFFEVLDISLAELDTKKSMKVTLLSEGITKEVRFLV